MLADIRVIEVASWMLAPSACAILAEWGADVIKIEDPVRGDPQRGLVTGLAGSADTSNFMVELPNRGKRSAAIDIATSDGLELLYRLIESADVFVTNHLPAIRKRLGIDVDEVRARNPRIIYACASAHGPLGDEADRGGFDSATYWSRAGLAATLQLPGEDWPPAPRPGIGDMMGGLALAGGISTALLHRERTGDGNVVDVSLLSLGLWQLSADVTAAKLGGDEPPPVFDRDALPNPLVGTYRTRDGRFIQLMMMQSDRYWNEFCRFALCLDLADDPRFCDAGARFANSRECTRLLRELFAARSLDEWRVLFAGFGGIWAPLNLAREVHDDPQVVANGYIQTIQTMRGAALDVPANPIRFDQNPPSVSGAPEHGQHTEEVLMDLGLSFEEILKHKAKGTLL
jgi:crotonobetainyl-CoA:carnitine CoA-transferase CaiB-like acyl-CoA transferase